MVSNLLVLVLCQKQTCSAISRLKNIFIKSVILVPRGRTPFSQHQESRPLTGPDFLNMRREFVSYSQSVRFVRRFVRLNSEHAQSDGKSIYRALLVFDLARGCQRSRFLVPTKRSAASGYENENSLVQQFSKMADAGDIEEPESSSSTLATTRNENCSLSDSKSVYF